MKLSFAVLVVIVLYTYNSGPCTAYPSNNEMQGDGSGDEEERANNIREILEGEQNEENEQNVNESDSDSEYDIIHKVVIDNSNDEDDEVGEDDEEEESDDDDDDGDDDDEDIDDTLPYEKYKLWTEGRGWPKHPLYVIILGGFRWDYLDIHKDTFGSFEYLKHHGTFIPHVKPVFPPEDYPVWTSMATGLYPEEHDITGDLMFDLKSRNFFTKGDFAKTRVASWWESVKPFWSTAAGAGRKVAFFNWHDCRIPGAMLENPSDCLPYPSIGPTNNSLIDTEFDSSSEYPFIPSHTSVGQQFDAAFTKIHKEKYDIAVIYTDLIRKKVERYGPESEEVNEALHDVDDILQNKLTDINAKNENADLSMNVLVISDYGLTDTSTLNDVNFEDYLDEDDYQFVIYTTGYAKIVPYALSHNKILLDCAEMKGVDVYLTDQVQDPPIWHGVKIPESFKYGNGKYAQDILLVAQPAYQLISSNETNEKIISVNGFSDDTLLKGGAGRNPYLEEVKWPKIKKGQVYTNELNATISDYHDFHQHKYDMHTRAYMMGPDFKENYEVENEIEVVDFYQLICFLLQIPPEEHSGSWERIEDMLKISGSPSLSKFTITPFVMMCIASTLIHFY